MLNTKRESIYVYYKQERSKYRTLLDAVCDVLLKRITSIIFNILFPI